MVRNLSENESSNLIDGVSYPVSTTWREIAQIALDLADGADWFDRYYKMNDSKKENNCIALLHTLLIFLGCQFVGYKLHLAY